MIESTPIPVALTIAGSDSGGGAGIQADLKTFHRFRVFGTSVVTAITAQNTLGVHAIHAVPLDHVTAQLEAVATDLRPAALKSGMLATAALVVAVAEGIARFDLQNYVLDPVMVATTGARLLETNAESALRDVLLPLATVLTPNLEEAAILARMPVSTLDEMEAAARRLVGMGAGAVLVKGGHLQGRAVDLLFDGVGVRHFSRDRIDTPHTHGTGCTLSAAIAARLAHGDVLHDAVEAATTFVGRAIASAPGLGSGRGPVDHFA